jgi:hypothetical protein
MILATYQERSSSFFIICFDFSSVCLDECPISLDRISQTWVSLSFVDGSRINSEMRDSVLRASQDFPSPFFLFPCAPIDAKERRCKVARQFCHHCSPIFGPRQYMSLDLLRVGSVLLSRWMAGA